MATVYLTNRAKVEAQISAVGVALRIDHDPTNAFTEAVLRASADIMLYLGTRYSGDELLSDDWVTGVATDRAIMYLCRWRNNLIPKSLMDAWEETRETLKDIAMGKLNLPGVSLGDSRAPQIVHVTTNYGMNPSVRRTKQGTTNSPNGYAPNIDPFEPPQN